MFGGSVVYFVVEFCQEVVAAMMFDATLRGILLQMW
jgi:hypothetical protein